MRIQLSNEELLQIKLRDTYIPPYNETNFIHSDIPRVYNMNINIPIKGKLGLTEGIKMFAPFTEVVETSEILKYLGYTSIQVIDLMKNLKNSSNPLVFIGFGGINNGIVYWLIKLGELIDNQVMKNKTIYLFDGDDWEIHNLPRVHFLSQSKVKNKALWFHDHNFKTNEVGEVVAFPQYLNANNLKKFYHSFDGTKLPLIIGAPDSNTRKLLTESPYCNYLFVGQYQEKLNMWINPIMVEKSVDSYGWVDANMFPLVTLQATLKLLETLPKVNSKKKVDEYHIQSMNFAKFVKKYDSKNLFGVIPSNKKWSNLDGFRDKVKGE